MESHTNSALDIPKLSALLVEALNKRGMIMQADSAFQQYSVGNQLFALVQRNYANWSPAPSILSPDVY